MISESRFKSMMRERTTEPLDVAEYVYRGESVPPHCKNWLKLAKDQDNQQLFIEASRRHFKSRTFSVIYPLWNIIKNPEINILLASETIGQSKKWLREIKGHIENRQSPYSYLKQENPEKWAEKEIIVDRVDPSADPTVSVTGVGKSILGSGADLIILDDPVSEKNSRTQLQRDKLEEWFYTVLSPILEPDGQMIVVGTPWNEKDLYQLFREDPGWQHYQFPAEMPDDPEPYHSDYYNNPDDVLWFPKWSRENLKERKSKMGSVYYAMSYLLDLSEVKGGIIDPSWMEYYGSLPPGNDLIYMMGVDPSIGESDKSDYTAIIIIARSTETGNIYVIDADQGRWQSQERIKKIQEYYERYPIHKIAIEESSISKDFIAMLRRETMLPLDPISHMGKDKVSRLQTISPRIENGDILFSLGLRKSQVPFIDQLVEFPKGSFDDLVDAFVYACWMFFDSYSDGIFELFKEG